MALRLLPFDGTSPKESLRHKSRQHRSLYKYTVTIDLDRIGSEEHNETLDPKDRIKLLDKPEDRANRVNEFLEVIKNLYRDIRGRREDLKPLFIIGGVYPVKNPFFMNGVKIEWENGKPKIVKEAIDEMLNSKYCYKSNGKRDEILKEEKVRTNTVIGIRNGIFANGSSFDDTVNKAVKGNDRNQIVSSEKQQEQKKGTNTVSPEDAIDTLKLKVKEFYGEKQWKS